MYFIGRWEAFIIGSAAMLFLLITELPIIKIYNTFKNKISYRTPKQHCIEYIRQCLNPFHRTQTGGWCLGLWYRALIMSKKGWLSPSTFLRVESMSSCPQFSKPINSLLRKQYIIAKLIYSHFFGLVKAEWYLNEWIVNRYMGVA